MIDWPYFTAAIGFNWTTTAPSAAVVSSPADSSWVPNLGHLVNGLGWPLFGLATVGWIFGVTRVPGSGSRSSADRAYLVHVVWVTAFLGFYGLSTVHALRYIMPVVPSLVLLAAALSVRMVRAAGRQGARARALAIGVVAGTLAYSLAYSARADALFLSDTRYQAGRWLSAQRPADPVHYFSFGAYLPFFHEAAPGAVHVPTLSDLDLAGNEFWLWATGYLDRSTNLIVDPDFYRRRFFDRPLGFAERAQFYRLLLDGSSSGGYREVARFEAESTAWLDPRPEFVSPQLLIFAKPETRVDPAVGPAPGPGFGS